MLEYQQFQMVIRDVLNHLSDVAYLENHNLIAPFLSEEEANQPNHIQLLHAKIERSIKSLRPPEDVPSDAAEWRCSRILTMRYLNNMDLHLVADNLGLSQRQVYRELKKGLEALFTVLWKQQTIHTGLVGQAEEASATSDNLSILHDELKNWEINYTISNLYEIVEEAYQLFEQYANNDLCSRVHLDTIDRDLNVRVNPTLTKQGLYKVLSILEDCIQDSEVWMKTRMINEQFSELAITICHSQPLELRNWRIAQLFFIVQGINHSLTEQDDKTSIAISIPMNHPKKALVIDDVASVRSLIQRMLGPFSIQVFGADNIQEAIKLAQLIKPDFILLDILMPNTDGWQAIKMLKFDSETKNIPIFICSVLNEPKLALSLGATGFIRKPINRQALIDTLQQSALIEIE